MTPGPRGWPRLASVRIELEIPVRCGGEIVGTVADVVIDPSSRRLTHVVVETKESEVRLVPVELVGDAADRREVVLTCSIEELHGLESVREYASLRADELPPADADFDVGVEEVLTMASDGYTGLGDYVGDVDAAMGVIYDKVPKGEAEIRRSSAVISSDDHHLGHVEGFVIDGGRVTHLVLERGHLWGKRDVTIPVDSVGTIETDTVTLSLTKDEVGKLPAVRVHR